MIIRRETASDFDEIYNLVKIAFQTAKVSNGKEQDFVNELRGSQNYIPELALVAQKNEILIGHIMLTRKMITTNNSDFEMLYLAPVSVVLEHRNKGVGSKLINESFKIAKQLGYNSVILVGDPAYYSRFGFATSKNFGITSAQNIPAEYVLACELIPNTLKGIEGTVSF